MEEYPLVWIIIGIAGCGKTTIGRQLSQWLSCNFIEGDRYHSPANITKMSSEQPLEDKDRERWLGEIEDDVRRAIDLKKETVITCSAPKQSYRKQLSLERVQLIWIDVPVEVLKQRLANRTNHFMPPSMLDSQIDAFEAIAPSENVITVNGNRSIHDVIQDLTAQALERYPHLNKPWWQRYE